MGKDKKGDPVKPVELLRNAVGELFDALGNRIGTMGGLPDMRRGTTYAGDVTGLRGAVDYQKKESDSAKQ